MNSLLMWKKLDAESFTFMYLLSVLHEESLNFIFQII